jgi:hypothetical protein
MAPTPTVNISSGLRLGAVIGGVLVAAVTQVLLMTIGAAIGLTAFSAVDQAQTEVQLGYAAWLVISLFVSVLIGSYVAAAGSRSPWRKDGLLHGAVTWAAIGLLGFFIVGQRAEDLLGGALRLAGRTAVATAPDPGAARVVEEHARAAEGRVDAVQGTIDRVRATIDEAGSGLGAVRAAEGAREGLAIGLWSFLGVNLLLLVAALIGGAAGVTGARRHVARLTRETAVVVPRRQAGAVADTAMPVVPRGDVPAT